MFTLNLLRLTPLSKETHLVAVVFGVLAFLINYLAVPNATATSSFSTAILAGTCWYVFKAFDGLTYDEAESSIGTMVGLLVCGVICAIFFSQ